MVKLSKSAKDRIKRMHKKDRAVLCKGAMHLADNDVISDARYVSLIRYVNSLAGR